MSCCGPLLLCGVALAARTRPRGVGAVAEARESPLPLSALLRRAQGAAAIGFGDGWSRRVSKVFLAMATIFCLLLGAPFDADAASRFVTHAETHPASAALAAPGRKRALSAV